MEATSCSPLSKMEAPEAQGLQSQSTALAVHDDLPRPAVLSADCCALIWQYLPLVSGPEGSDVRLGATVALRRVCRSFDDGFALWDGWRQCAKAVAHEYFVKQCRRVAWQHTLSALEPRLCCSKELVHVARGIHSKLEAADRRVQHIQHTLLPAANTLVRRTGGQPVDIPWTAHPYASRD